MNCRILFWIRIVDNKGRAGKEEERGWGLMIKYNQFASDIRIENDFMDFLIEL